MNLVSGSLGKLPSKLLELLKDEYKLQTGVKDQIRKGAEELKSMHAALRKVEQVPSYELDEQVLLWAHNVREASYDMEDILDTFLVRVDGGANKEPIDEAKVKRLMKKIGNIFSLSKVKARHKIADAIDALSKHLEDVAKLRGRYTVDDIKPIAATSIDPRLSAIYTKVTQLVGIDEPMNKLIQMLTIGDDDEVPNKEMRIVSVVGSGGLGKTTLVKAVYEKLTSNIPVKAFVPVGQNPDLKKVFRDILMALEKEAGYVMRSNFTIMDERQLIDELREFLKDKRYFIVIDDVWDVRSWNTIRHALDDSSLGSKIVITTRKHDVAVEVGCSYGMKPLCYESSKILFYTRIFGSEDKCPKDFSEVSEKFLKRCGGVPLAIITTSSMLANKLGNIQEWNMLYESIGLGLGSNEDDMDNMKRILSLSYYDLPSHLKTCLLYLSTFPEDYEINKYRLIWRWMAEDFVQHAEGSKSLFELGESYFNELLNRSLIQVADTGLDGTPISCRVHDMVLELICSLSREQSFLTIVQGDGKQSTPSSHSKVRRLSLRSTKWPSMEISKLRSLSLFSTVVDRSMWSVSSCHLLRVLDLEDCNLKDRPNVMFVGNLFHLRFLSLSCTGYAGELPVEIVRLQFLQTLNLSGTEIEELPSSIVGLRQLMFLSVDESTRLPNGLRYLKSLELLEMATVDSADAAEELGHMKQLRMLAVILKGDNEDGLDKSLCTALVASIGKLHKMKILFVETGGVAADLDGSAAVSLGNLCTIRIREISVLPAWINPESLGHLSVLYIWVAQLRREDIQVLGMLPALRDLKVDVTEDHIQKLERSFVVSPDAFPVIITYELFGNFVMVPSMFPQGAMPRLEIFKFCIQLEDFSQGEFTVDDLALGHLPSLQRVVVVLRTKGKVSDEVARKVEAKLRREADVHPNNPSIFIP